MRTYFLHASVARDPLSLGLNKGNQFSLQVTSNILEVPIIFYIRQTINTGELETRITPKGILLRFWYHRR